MCLPIAFLLRTVLPALRNYAICRLRRLLAPLPARAPALLLQGTDSAGRGQTPLVGSAGQEYVQVGRSR